MYMVKGFLVLLISILSISFATCPLKDGDLIFIKSQSSQAALLRLATNSEWTHVGMLFKQKNNWEVIEAIQPVKWTSLDKFIARSKKSSFSIRRPNFSFNSSKLKEYSEQRLGKNYDLIFSWDEERWYCSELVFKAYQSVADQEIGSLEEISGLRVNRPEIKAEMQKRHNDYNTEFNEGTWEKSLVITPVSMLNSSKLSPVGNDSDNSIIGECLN
ncbi:MAG: hypothetical protein A2504_17205 [Bdellovibrionales bacterium RIFOXYD12_FULL_39_22]|nr:MAG: hypothetical protein A2385_10755 [Bdellovibrionales bacterium RIFOXYB1_FULL_39_21]OFZ40744.1 MAG: hypothetical protein A2485_16975 [Bdellovibrionales bacterium RIFOXYC12_FULL_39_17]OFZ48166.1 MAG: hypothetical protein A2404_17135 [Bdellovibrionales bacterium RIFOXYC1_FULL_39_130]OFZ75816.1 MAG: hypothetical protein A2560_13635 [Bdellovibrionales bacterium RIFOXYD1_FULL_39_84]OFZ76131.1 MAG: hypothetical protein A2451_11880 [Bdellovibrionales bacterium RIFOXYC2_FULL_39_8]OFZ91877.1 MAG: